MKIYTCGSADSGAPLHPCGRAIKALREAGHDPEIQKVRGYAMLPWTRRGDARAEVVEISGQKNVPVLVTDGGEVVTGSGTIVRWAKEHPASA